MQLAIQSTVLPENLTGPLLVNKLPAFYETPGFITALKKDLHVSLPSAISIQSTSSIPLFKNQF
jgi:hypothetical protein